MDKQGRLSSSVWIQWLQGVINSRGGELVVSGDDTPVTIEEYSQHVDIVDGNPHGTRWGQLQGRASFVPMETEAEVVPTEEGTLSWDRAHHALRLQSDDPTLAPTAVYDDWEHVENTTGATLRKGQPVYILDGGSDQMPSVAVADATDAHKAGLLGVVLADIKNDKPGYVCIRGRMPFDASRFTRGQVLFLSEDADEGVTATPPLPPAYRIRVGVVLDEGVDGAIYVGSSVAAASIVATDLAIAQKDPTGWLNPAGITVSYDSTSRKVTLTGDLRYYWQGAARALTSPWVSGAHDAIAGYFHYLSSVNGSDFTWSPARWNYYDLMVAVVSYDVIAGPTSKFCLRELHSFMPWTVHEALHTLVGMYRKSGGALSGYVLDSTVPAYRQPVVSATELQAEDAPTTNPSLLAGAYSVALLQGAGPTLVVVPGQSNIVGVTSNQPSWNALTLGLWGEVGMANNSYMSVWLVAIPATGDVDSQKLRFLWLTGQSNGSLEGQQALTPLDLNTTKLDAFYDYVFLAKVIIRYQSSNWSITSVTNIAGSRALLLQGSAGIYCPIGGPGVNAPFKTGVHTAETTGAEQYQVVAAGTTYGGILLAGGGSNPNKYLRSYNGNLEGVNSANTAVIFTVSDTGAFAATSFNSITGLAGSGSAATASKSDHSHSGYASFSQGTFTPTLTVGTAEVSYSSRSGYYSVTGNVLTFKATINVSALNGSGDSAVFGGLPLGAYSVPADNFCHVTIAFGNLSAVVPIWLYLQGGYTYGSIMKQAATDLVAILRSDFGSTPSVWVTGSYFV